MLAVIPKRCKWNSKELYYVRSRKLNHGGDEAYINEEQKESDVKLADIKRLFDLLVKKSVYQHTAESVNRKPRTEKHTSVSPDAVIEICPYHLVYPSAHREKDKQ
jgi:hypothetical protein